MSIPPALPPAREADLGLAVADAERLCQHVRRAGRQLGLTAMHAKMVLVLEDPMTAAELGDVLGVGSDNAFRSLVRRNVVELRKLGLIRGGDNRAAATRIHLTAQGIRVRQEISNLVIGNGISNPGAPHVHQLDT